MLATLLLWIYITALAFVFGFTLLRLLPVDPLSDPTCRPSLPLLAIAGLAVISGVANLLSLVINLGFLASLLMLAAGLALAWWQRQPLVPYLRQTLAGLRQMHWLVVLAFLAVSGVVLLKSVGLPENYDTGLYHAQVIRWAETYRTVPGLGNLTDRLAFNSSWLVLSALFSFSFLGLQSFHVLNSLLPVLMTAYALSRFSGLFKGDLGLSNLAAITLPFLLRRIFSLELSSPGTDLPAALLLWVLVILSLTKIDEGRSARQDYNFWLALILALFAVTVKLSVLPVLLLPVYFFLRQAKPKLPVSLAGAAALAALLMFPWMARSFVLSGYLAYPLWQINIIQPDWQIPPDHVRSAVDWVQSWAKIATDQREWVQSLSIGEWLPIWFQNLVSLDRQVVVVNALSVIPLVGVLAAQLRKNRLAGVLRSPMLVVYFCLLAGIAFWFFQAPAPRFGYGFLALFPVLCLVPYGRYILERLPALRIWAAALALIALLLYQGVSAARMVKSDDLRPVLLLPQPYPTAAVEPHSVGGLTIYTPETGDQCWYEAFPCAPRIDPALELRGERVVDGFRLRQQH